MNKPCGDGEASFKRLPEESASIPKSRKRKYDSSSTRHDLSHHAEKANLTESHRNGSEGPAIKKTKKDIKLNGQSEESYQNKTADMVKSGLATLFDVHYGRVRRPHQDIWGTKSTFDTAEAIPPESYLTKRHAKGIRCYPLVDSSNLPSSELVLAVHFYVSQQCHKYGRNDLFQLYDETVLLSIAIELEELIKKQLGPNGHLAFAQIKGASDI